MLFENKIEALCIKSYELLRENVEYINIMNGTCLAFLQIYLVTIMIDKVKNIKLDFTPNNNAESIIDTLKEIDNVISITLTIKDFVENHPDSNFRKEYIERGLSICNDLKSMQSEIKIREKDLEKMLNNFDISMN